MQILQRKDTWAPKTKPVSEHADTHCPVPRQVGIPLHAWAASHTTLRLGYTAQVPERLHTGVSPEGCHRPAGYTGSRGAHATGRTAEALQGETAGAGAPATQA